LAKPEGINSHPKWLEQENLVISSVPQLPKLIFMSQKHGGEEKTYVPAFVALWRIRPSIPLSGRTPGQNGAPLSYVYLAVNRTQFSTNLTC
jgi:hypothetical protein